MNTPIIQTAEQWASEGIAKYGDGAAAWIGRWKVNCSDCPADLKQLDEALKIINAHGAIWKNAMATHEHRKSGRE